MKENLLLAVAALLLGACSTAPSGARYTAPDTKLAASQIDSASRAISRASTRAKRLQEVLAVPLVRPEDRANAQREAGDLGTDLADAARDLVKADNALIAVQTAATQQTTALNATVVERDQLRAENKTLKAQTGWWARLKHNAVLFCAAFLAGMAGMWALRLAGGATALAARVGIKAATGVMLMLALTVALRAVTILSPQDYETLGAQVNQPFTFRCRSSQLNASWFITGLPPGLQAFGGLILGTPKEAGTWEVSIQAFDGPGTPEPDPAAVVITIVVEPAAENAPAEATPFKSRER